MHECLVGMLNRSLDLRSKFSKMLFRYRSLSDSKTSGPVMLFRTYFLNALGVRSEASYSMATNRDAFGRCCRESSGIALGEAST